MTPAGDQGTIKSAATAIDYFAPADAGKNKMNCLHCGKPVVLNPSAAERARKCGGTPSDYTRLFSVHADCQIKLRRQGVSELIQRLALTDTVTFS